MLIILINNNNHNDDDFLESKKATQSMKGSHFSVNREKRERERENVIWKKKVKLLLDDDDDDDIWWFQIIQLNQIKPWNCVFFWTRKKIHNYIYFVMLYTRYEYCVDKRGEWQSDSTEISDIDYFPNSNEWLRIKIIGCGGVCVMSHGAYANVYLCPRSIADGIPFHRMHSTVLSNIYSSRKRPQLPDRFHSRMLMNQLMLLVWIASHFQFMRVHSINIW